MSSRLGEFDKEFFLLFGGVVVSGSQESLEGQMRFGMQEFKKEKQENKSRKTLRWFEDLGYSQRRSFKYTNIH